MTKHKWKFFRGDWFERPNWGYYACYKCLNCGFIIDLTFSSSEKAMQYIPQATYIDCNKYLIKSILL